MDDDLKNRIQRNLVARRAEQFEFLRRLVGTPSENPPGDGEAAAELTAGTLKELGFAVERHRVANELAARHGAARITNLVARSPFGSGNVVALHASGDTAPKGEGWTVDPFAAAIDNGVMSGLGVLGKADIAAYAYALAALRDADPDLAGTVELHVTFDGETGGELGPLWLMQKGIVNPDYAIASGLAHGIGTATMGDLQMEVTLEAGQATGQGRPGDAMAAAGRIIGALYDMNDAFAGIVSSVKGVAGPSIMVGEIEGGSRPDRRPGRVAFGLVRRMIPDEDPGVVEKSLTRLIAEVASLEDGIDCRIRRLKLVAPMKPGPGTARLLATLERQASASAGEAIGSYGVSFDTPARHYAALGVPTLLYGAGPATAEEANMGMADERLRLDDLRLATEVVALALARFMAQTA